MRSSTHDSSRGSQGSLGASRSQCRARVTASSSATMRSRRRSSSDTRICVASILFSSSRYSLVACSRWRQCTKQSDCSRSPDCRSRSQLSRCDGSKGVASVATGRSCSSTSNESRPSCKASSQSLNKMAASSTRERCVWNMAISSNARSWARCSDDTTSRSIAFTSVKDMSLRNLVSDAVVSRVITLLSSRPRMRSVRVLACR
mmetsp:Transcript_9933/g.25121  ORF Transcript_9933/g.25121 Transcript_9933/m.25121 type:complete len:203 (-) Transcript_9933:46-654(-)